MEIHTHISAGIYLAETAMIRRGLCPAVRVKNGLCSCHTTMTTSDNPGCRTSEGGEVRWKSELYALTPQITGCSEDWQDKH